ncbi:hypothetical protein [Hyphomicrobium sp. DY-1]|uniref:hypothetical protein n=1 Tax=Hyphomicrobium sp. DY-1 TaxID=3075650 RepID=UPI0039C38DD4
MMFDSASNDAILFLTIIIGGIVMPFVIALSIEIGNARKNRCAWRDSFGGEQ